MKVIIKYEDTEIMNFILSGCFLDIDTKGRKYVSMTQDEAFKCGKLVGMLNYGLKNKPKPLIKEVLIGLPNLLANISDNFSVEFDEEFKNEN